MSRRQRARYATDGGGDPKSGPRSSFATYLTASRSERAHRAEGRRLTTNQACTVILAARPASRVPQARLGLSLDCEETSSARRSTPSWCSGDEQVVDGHRRQVVVVEGLAHHPLRGTHERWFALDRLFDGAERTFPSRPSPR